MLLFDETSTNNLTYSTGLVWGKQFGVGATFGVDPDDKKFLTGRSHFGDLQWLHAMGSKLGGKPSDTKLNILHWMETMYKVAIDALDVNTKISDTWLGRFFDNPDKYNTIGELLHQRHKSRADIQTRALSSCFHVLQDSYAIGHTRREPLKPKDRETGSKIKYKPGVADRWGAVLNFHTYSGQGKEHKDYDHSHAKVEGIDLGNINVWNQFVGCRDGVDACIKLANYAHGKARWDEVYTWLDSVVFKLSKDATPSDNSVL